MTEPDTEAAVPVLDELDAAILRILHVDGRASWAQVAEELGSSTSTVRRRFESLQQRGWARVVGRVDIAALGPGLSALVRFRGAHASSEHFLTALRDREDVRYVGSVMGAAESLAEVVARSLSALDAAVRGISAEHRVKAEPFVLTHTYTSGQDWLPDSVPRWVDYGDPRPETPLNDAEATLLGMLMRNGRASLGELAEVIDKSENTARRTMESLRQREILDFRVMVEPLLLGLEAEFWIWLDTDPSALASVGATLAAHPATKFLAATTGRYGLVGQIVLPHHSDIYSYASRTLGGIEGIRGVEMMPQARALKRAWNLIDGDRYTGICGPDWVFGT